MSDVIPSLFLGQGDGAVEIDLQKQGGILVMSDPDFEGWRNQVMRSLIRQIGSDPRANAHMMISEPPDGEILKLMGSANFMLTFGREPMKDDLERTVQSNSYTSTPWWERKGVEPSYIIVPHVPHPDEDFSSISERNKWVTSTRESFRSLFNDFLCNGVIPIVGLDFDTAEMLHLPRHHCTTVTIQTSGPGVARITYGNTSFEFQLENLL